MSDHDHDLPSAGGYVVHPDETTAHAVHPSTGNNALTDFLTDETIEQLRDLEARQFDYFRRPERALTSQLQYPTNGFK